MTSTIGVTLMPTIPPRRRPRPPEVEEAMAHSPAVGAASCVGDPGWRARRTLRSRGSCWTVLLRSRATRSPREAMRRRRQALRDRRDVVLDVANLLLEDVVGDDGGDRDEEPDARGDERLGDAAHHLVHLHLVLAVGEIGERHDDADDRAQQPDERRVVAEGAEQRHPALELPAPLGHLARRWPLRARPDRPSPSAATRSSTSASTVELVRRSGSAFSSSPSSSSCAQRRRRAPRPPSRASGSRATARPSRRSTRPTARAAGT